MDRSTRSRSPTPRPRRAARPRGRGSSHADEAHVAGVAALVVADRVDRAGAHHVAACRYPALEGQRPVATALGPEVVAVRAGLGLAQAAAGAQEPALVVAELARHGDAHARDPAQPLGPAAPVARGAREPEAVLARRALELRHA